MFVAVWIRFNDPLYHGQCFNDWLLSYSLTQLLLKHNYTKNKKSMKKRNVIPIRTIFAFNKITRTNGS